ncbi:decarboxylating 6-phosphogluconate dehydrogenase [Candidatus Nitrosocosmicus sp. SS]|jgi:6-phosphogluconate dehydrogenase|nr:decarboxylating 6-phosphogluconate dehydrogenase [Candidatus Nitrosocosmicus sp. SS]KAF0869832.1 decarboxylating 6-phosphogluconate dehydrogenase [Candidatus Nitrosocosmicus sp. SS]
MKLGIVGLGKMGGNLSLQAIEKNISVVGKVRNGKPELENQGVKLVTDYDSFFSFLGNPRVIYLSLPAGHTVDEVIGDLLPYLNQGDVILDGGNSFYLDSIEREKRLYKKGIYFLDCGTSGGIDGARHGACFMVGGRDQGVRIAEPFLKKLAINSDGFVHTGAPGSGHFVKLVHNGIEFGMLQAIGEGVSLLLEKNDFNLNLEEIFHNWSNGSVIRGWLVELMEKGLKETNFSEIQSYIEDTGEVNWLIQDAINKEIPIPVISASIMSLFRSRIKDIITYKAIALMRHEFGGHPFGKNEDIIKERSTSRITKI